MMDSPSTSYSSNVEKIAVERHLANKFLNGELTFAEYSEKWFGSVDDNDDKELEENECEVTDQDSDAESCEESVDREPVDDGTIINERVKRVRTRQRRRLPAALAGLMGEANLRYARGDHATAEKICYEIIRQTPTASEPFQTLAQIYESDLDKSLEFSLIAAHLNPDATEWIRLAGILRGKGDTKQEIFCLTKAIKADPKNISNHLLRLERLQYLEKNNMAPVGCISSIVCRIALMNSYPDSEGKTVVEMAKCIASEYHINSKVHLACNIMDKAYKRFSSLFTYEDLNLYLELLIAQKQFDKCINIFVEKGGIEVEEEYQTIVDGDLITEVTSPQIVNCNIPETLPIDLKTKLIICLIHLKAFNLVELYLSTMIANEDVETNGDIFLDIEEALTSESQHLEAFRLLTLLVNSENFSLPAVWLKYAECLVALNKTAEAIKAYETVVKLAPQHLNARITLATLYKNSNCIDEAYKALIQDERIDILDTALLYERCSILKIKGNLKEYLRIGHLLLSRHFYTIRDKSEMPLLILKDVYDQLKALRETRGESFEEPDPLIFEESSDKLTLEVEWELLMDLFHTAYELKEYSTLQRISFLALASKRFSPYRRNLELIALLSSYYNSDPYYAFSLLRDFIVKMSNKTNIWNLMALILQKGEDVRTSRFLHRFFLKKPDCSNQINILMGNYYLKSGSYRCALKEYLLSYDEKPSSLCAFLCGVSLIQLASQKFAINRNTLVVQATAFFKIYERMRSKDATHECLYNTARAFHQMGLFHLAREYYERALRICNDLIISNPEIFSLRREIAFNLHVLLKNTCPSLALNYLLKYIVF